ncbi:unnamed protein product [Rotaria sordida]|uniref:Uncharacterized protein n=3 Tax=Rotaria sordida TaxID=392033 RepID=A0A819XMI1_9BILA|nr:unnamed protein product [Rotaria sordida]
MLIQKIERREMQLLDMVRRKMLHQQHHLLKEAELHRLDDEIRKKLQTEERQDIVESGIKSTKLKTLALEI